MSECLGTLAACYATGSPVLVLQRMHYCLVEAMNYSGRSNSGRPFTCVVHIVENRQQVHEVRTVARHTLILVRVQVLRYLQDAQHRRSVGFPCVGPEGRRVLLLLQVLATAREIRGDRHTDFV